MIILEKKIDKDFVVLNLSDVQASSSEWNEEHKHFPLINGTIREVIQRVKPDLITLSGDLSWAGDYMGYEALASCLEEYKTPWAVAWGNHDEQEGIEKLDKTIEGYFKHKYFTYENGPSELGRGNYVIAIKEGDSIVSAFILMDTHDRIPMTDENGNEQLVWSKVTPEQIEWYKEQIKALKEMGCNDTTLITHIPIHAYMEAFEAAFDSSLKPEEVTAEQSAKGYGWRDGYKGAFGVKYDTICCCPIDDHFLDAILEGETTKNCIAGHDHTSSFSIPYKGVRLSYGLKTGCGCYWNPLLNGGTVIKINQNGVYDIHHEYVDRSMYL